MCRPANSASFQGFDGSTFRITEQLSIGFAPGGGPADDIVGVRLFRNTGESKGSSFTLVLVCP